MSATLVIFQDLKDPSELKAERTEKVLQTLVNGKLISNVILIKHIAHLSFRHSNNPDS